MRIKTYRAINIQEAMQQVKRDLGPEAIILTTRKVVEGKKAFGLLGRPMVEVTAAIDDGEGGSMRSTDRGSLTEIRENAASDGLDPLRDEIRTLKLELRKLQAAAALGAKGLPLKMERDLSELRWLTDEVARGLNARRLGSLPEGLRWAFQILLRNGVRESYARRLVDNLRGGDGVCLKDGPKVRELLADHMERFVSICEPMGGPESRIVALVGPTGVGKTTTVAKIAAQQALGEGKGVALVTVDTYRIAAVEQLRIYARIMGIPMEVVVSPDGMREAVNRFSDKDLILIDTAGRSPADTEQVNELKAFIDEVKEIRTYLLISATTRDQDMDLVVRRFGALGIDALIITKVDETTSFGPVFNLAVGTGLPLAYFTTGQRVPEDIRAARRRDVVEWTLYGVPSFSQIAAMEA